MTETTRSKLLKEIEGGITEYVEANSFPPSRIVVSDATCLEAFETLYPSEVISGTQIESVTSAREKDLREGRDSLFDVQSEVTLEESVNKNLDLEDFVDYDTIEELWKILSHPGWTTSEDTSHPPRYSLCICEPQVDSPVSLILRLVVPEDYRWYFAWELARNSLLLSGRVPGEIRTVEEAIEYAKQESARSYQDWCRKVESQEDEYSGGCATI